MSFFKRILQKTIKPSLVIWGLTFLSTVPYVTHAAWWEFKENVAWFFTGILLAIGSAFTYIGGAIFNFGIKYGIVEFSQFGNASGIFVAWSVLRDIANIGLIFIFLAVGIATILGVQQYGAKNLLPKLIIVALFINFSLFATRFLIDTSHIFAASILNASGVQAECSTNVVANDEQNIEQARQDCDITEGLSEQFLYHFNVASLFNAEQESLPTDASVIFLFGFLGFIFLVITGIGFLAAGIMLFFRMGMLIILMVGSAVAFTAIILPNTQKFWDQWFGRLTKELFVAPAMILMFAITLLFLNSASEILFPNGEKPSFIDAINSGSVNNISVIVLFIVSIILFLLSIKIAQDFGGLGGRVANRLAAKAGFGASAALGRTTIGRAGEAIATNKSFQQYAGKKRSGVASLYGGALRGVLRTSNAASKSSFDMREAPGVRAGAKAAGVSDLGKAQKGGRVGHVKEVTGQASKKADVFTDAEAKLSYSEILKSPGLVGSTWEAVRSKRAGTRKAGEAVGKKAATEVRKEKLAKINKDYAERISKLTDQIREKQTEIDTGKTIGGFDLTAREKEKADLVQKRKELDERRKFEQQELKDINAVLEKEKKEDDKK